MVKIFISIYVVIMYMRIIYRRIELLRFEGEGWKMFYGRWKIGKIFFVRNFFDYDEFFFVEWEGMVRDLNEGFIMIYGEFMRFFFCLLKGGKVVVDEFYRLLDRFFDFFYVYFGIGEFIFIILICWLVKRKFFGIGSLFFGIV